MSKLPDTVKTSEVLAVADYYRDLAFAYGDCINDSGRQDHLVDDAVHSIKASLCREFSDELYRLAGMNVAVRVRRPETLPLATRPYVTVSLEPAQRPSAFRWLRGLFS